MNVYNIVFPLFFMLRENEMCPSWPVLHLWIKKYTVSHHVTRSIDVAVQRGVPTSWLAESNQSAGCLLLETRRHFISTIVTAATHMLKQPLVARCAIWQVTRDYCITLLHYRRGYYRRGLGKRLATNFQICSACDQFKKRHEVRNDPKISITSTVGTDEWMSSNSACHTLSFGPRSRKWDKGRSTCTVEDLNGSINPDCRHEKH